MKSRAHIKSHPLHPILVAFPIAFFIGTFIFDILALIVDKNDFITTAQYLEIAGIGFALLAAIPGMIDFIFTVPPKSSAKKRAATHGLINVTVVLVFIVALILRRGQEFSLWIITALEAIGVVLLTIAGWMGGTLVYRNQIGVDLRYAHAGKWKEEYKNQSSGKIEVATVDELNVNQMKLIHIGRKRIVLCRTENGYAAFDDRCTHRGGSLAGGALICETVQCPWHSSQFSVHNGAVKAGPAKTAINTYPVDQEAGKVYVNIQ